MDNNQVMTWKLQKEFKEKDKEIKELKYINIV